MKSRARRVTVHGVAYHWKLTPGDERGIVVAIWSVAAQSNPSRLARPAAGGLWASLLPTYRDPWLHPDEGESQPIAPGLIRRIIEAGIAAGWQPESSPDPLHIARAADDDAPGKPTR